VGRPDYKPVYLNEKRLTGKPSILLGKLATGVHDGQSEPVSQVVPIKSLKAGIPLRKTLRVEFTFEV
jgi:hypothetical protein